MLYSSLKFILALHKPFAYQFKHSINVILEGKKSGRRKEFSWGFNRPTFKQEETVKSALMPLDEARSILQVGEDFTIKDVEDRFNKLFNLNDPQKGGSYFIQCKVMGAKLSLTKHLQDKENPEKKEEKKEEKTEETKTEDTKKTE